MNDLRVPIGAFFLLLGAILVLTPDSGSVQTDASVNQYTGAVSAAFGGVMLVLSRRR